MTAELGAAFLLGLLGGVHCLGMCGPIALAVAAGPSAGRFRTVLNPCLYNTGRVITYALLGVLVGLFGHALRLAGLQQSLSIAAGIAVLLGAAVHVGAPHLLHPGHAWFAWLAALKRAWARLFSQRSPAALVGIGLLNGLLPCGLVLVALAGATAAGTAAGGAAFMASFGAGTFLPMLGVSLAGRVVQVSIRRHIQPLVPVGMALLAALLILRGLGLGIPYLSPVLDTPPGAPSGGHSCCH